MMSHQPKATVSVDEITISGSFGSREMPARLYRSARQTDEMVVNVHGAYGELSDKYFELGRQLSGRGVANVLLYQSSRINENLSPGATFEERRANFGLKTFQDELEDLRRVLSEVSRLVPNQARITLNGNSLGGILAFYAAQEDRRIVAISTVASGTFIEANGALLLSSLPSRQDIKDVCAAFNGRVVCHVAGSDDMFTADATTELFNAVGSSNKQIRLHDSVDHSFRVRNGAPDPCAYNEIIQSVHNLVLGR